LKNFRLSAGIILAAGLLGFAGTFALESFTNLDTALQDRLYDFATGRWAVDAHAAGPRALFYHLPKLALALLGAYLLLQCLRWSRVPRWLPAREAVYLMTCLAVIPATVGMLKNITRAHCPSELRRYGGTEEYCRIFQARTAPIQKVQPHCFPAGHASGGFALFGLAFARRRKAWLWPGLLLGGMMGAYQMLKGAHFLSHTLATLFFALAVCAGWSLLVLRDEG